MVKKLSSYLLWWLSSWFLISKGIFKSIKKTLSTWPSLAALTLFMTEAAETGPKQRIQGHITPPPPRPFHLTRPHSWAHGWGESFRWLSVLKQTHDQWTDSIRETKWPYLDFAVPSPPRPGVEMDNPSQPLGKLAQGLSLTMTSTKTASPLWKLSPQSPVFCANILGFLGARFKKFG